METGGSRLNALQEQLASVHRQLETLTDGLHWLGIGSLGSSGILMQCLSDGLTQQLTLSSGIRMTETPHRVALIGPTGVGKSTTIAKLAWRYAVEHRIAVGVVTTDTVRVGAIEQIRTYCRHLDIPLEVVYRPDDVPAALERLAECDLILIDTPGGSQRNTEYLTELEQSLQAFDPAEVHLVLCAGQNTAVAREVLARYGTLQPDQVIFTKLDEAVGLLELFTLLIGSGLAISYLSAGPDIETALEIATVEGISRILARG
jgi:flagellar biosynthesis protein FlhF